MCGGTLEVNQGESTGVCEYCGTEQTLPRLDDERKINLYDRANHFRRNNDFDKAMGIYEQILNEDSTDAEAYWSLVLCRYGIEYVEDPATHKRVPTVNRAQYTSIYADEDYKSALQYADTYQKSIYEAEAKAIDEIQKGILEISQKEEPFDVFICYKETGNDGRRTPDSVLATELYHELTREGFKVFFSRITLEDKLGTAYEPYIFAALHSAKVMVALGTKAEYFNAVWVKNEWSRFLALIKSGERKTLIPAYKDMDPYDLPEEFSHLQAQDMSKLGFMSDLVRGINKILSSGKEPEAKETVVVNNSAGAGVAPLLKRAFMFLEDGEWAKADDFCEQVLNQDPENAEAYFGKLMAELQVHKAEQLETYPIALDTSGNYQKVVRFGDKAFKERMENYRLAQLYNAAKREMSKANSESEYIVTAALSENIADFRDAAEQEKKCRDKAEESRKEEIYQIAAAKANEKDFLVYQQEAIETFKKILGYKDVDERIAECERIIAQLKEKAEKERIERQRKEEADKKAAEAKAKKKKKAIIVSAIAVATAIVVAIITIFIIKIVNYKSAIELYNAGKYQEAYEHFSTAKGYKDSAEKAETVLDLYISAAEVGDTVLLGKYEQDNYTLNGTEDIEWLILAKKDNKALIISKYALDSKKYHEKHDDVTWKTCSMRKWLNESFFNESFNDGEKKRIQSTVVKADKNPDYNSSSENDTNDKVFLLSENEVEKYFDMNTTRQCKATTYAVAHGAYIEGEKGNCLWWIRSSGGDAFNALIVNIDGSINNNHAVDDYCEAVRPAMWISIDEIS